PLTTNTDVFAPSASTAHLVPRTAAIALPISTSNLARPDCFGTSRSRALLLSSTESTWPSRLRSLSSNFAPLSATIVIAVGQRSVCDPNAVGADVQPRFAGWAKAVPARRPRLEIARLATAMLAARASMVMAAPLRGYGRKRRMIRHRITGPASNAKAIGRRLYVCRRRLRFGDRFNAKKYAQIEPKTSGFSRIFLRPLS